MKHFIAFLIGFICITCCHAQENKVDSLKSILNPSQGIERIEILHMLTRELWLNYPEQALSFAKEALLRSNQIYDKRYISISLRLLAGVYYYKGDYKSSMKYNHESLDIALELNNPSLINNAYNNIGLLYHNLGNNQAALEYLLRSKTLKDSTNENYGLSTTLNNIGLVYLTTANYKKARSYFTNAYQKAMATNDTSIQIYSLNNTGLCCIRQGKLNEAIILFRRSQQLAERTQNFNWGSVALRGLGEVFQSTKQLDSAYKYYTEALDASRRIGDKSGISEGLHLLAKLANDKGQTNSAINYLNKSQRFAREINLRRQLLKNLELYISIYKKAGNKESVIQYQHLYATLLETHFKDVLNRNLSLVPIKLKEEADQKKLIQQQAELDRKTWSNTIYIIVLAGLLPLTIILFFLLRKLLKANQVIHNQKDLHKHNYESVKMLSEIGTQITSSLKIDEISEKVYENINNIMPAEVFSIAILNNEANSLDFTGYVEKGKKQKNFSFDLDIHADRLAIICLKSQDALFTNNMARDYPNYPKALVGQLPASSIYVPLMSKEKAVGVISIQSFSTNTYTDYHISILRNLAVFISIAIENAKSYNALRIANIEISHQKDIYKVEHDKIKKLSEIGTDILSTLSLENIVGHAYKNINNLIPSDEMTLGIYNPTTNELDFPGAMERGEKLAQFSYHLENDKKRLPVICFVEQKTLRINNIAEEYPEYPNPPVGERPASVLLAPIVQGDDKIGTLAVSSFSPHVYSAYHIPLLENLAIYIGIAIQNARNFERLDNSEKELKQHDIKLKHAFKMTRLASWEIDASTKEFILNQEFCNIVGDKFDRNKPRVSTLSFLKKHIHPEYYDQFVKIHDAHLSSDKSNLEKATTQILKKDGSIRWIQSSPTNVVKKNGKIQSAFGLIQDITELKEIEQDLIKSSKELSDQAAHLQESNHELNQAYQQLKELDQYKESMTAMIVHDFKNSLNTVINFSEREPNQKRLNAIRQAGRYMQNMVLNILDVQKFETASVKLSLANYNIAKCIQDAVDQLEYLIDQKSINLTIDHNHELQARIDYDLITRSIANILSNAIKYAPVNGRIGINTQQKNELIEISISDNGPGIPKDKLDLVFDKFAQIDAKKSGAVRSTGIGLTFCKMVVEAHMGTIGVESVVDMGSRFYFTVPVLDEGKVATTTSVPIPLADEEIELSSEDLVFLRPYIDKLKNWEVYDYSEVMELLNSIECQNTSINSWKEKLEKAVYNSNDEKYNALLNHKPNES